jgi:hypothetical protein
MKRMLCLACCACTAVVLVWVPAAVAQNTQCTGVMSGPIAGNVTVPAGATCQLLDANVSGNVTVQKDGAAVVALSTISGNYDCNNCLYADLHHSTVAHNSHINGAQQGGYMESNTIGGDLHVTTSSTGDGTFTIQDNTFGANVTFNNNSGWSRIAGNDIAGNLSCMNNSPAPASAANSARSMQGQCAPPE